MHKEILSKKQLNFLPFLKSFSSNFCLVGGTAIALQVGHRQSIDFDLFSFSKINRISLQKKIMKFGKIQGVLVDNKDEYTILIGGIKVTFLYYPFKFEVGNNIDNIINTPDLITLAALKAYALGRRSKWKDYIDLYFIFKSGVSLKRVVNRANKIFGNNFNEKIFRTQLAYFSDIDYSEKVIYLKDFEVDDKEVRKFLIAMSLS